MHAFQIAPNRTNASICLIGVPTPGIKHWAGYEFQTQPGEPDTNIAWQPETTLWETLSDYLAHTPCYPDDSALYSADSGSLLFVYVNGELLFPGDDADDEGVVGASATTDDTETPDTENPDADDTADDTDDEELEDLPERPAGMSDEIWVRYLDGTITYEEALGQALQEEIDRMDEIDAAA